MKKEIEGLTEESLAGRMPGASEVQKVEAWQRALLMQGSLSHGLTLADFKIMLSVKDSENLTQFERIGKSFGGQLDEFKKEVDEVARVYAMAKLEASCIMGPKRGKDETDEDAWNIVRTSCQSVPDVLAAVRARLEWEGWKLDELDATLAESLGK